MKTKALWWFREMMDYYEVGKLEKKLPGEGKLGKLCMSKVGDEDEEPVFKVWETARTKGKG